MLRQEKLILLDINFLDNGVEWPLSIWPSSTSSCAKDGDNCDDTLMHKLVSVGEIY